MLLLLLHYIAILFSGISAKKWKIINIEKDLQKDMKCLLTIFMAFALCSTPLVVSQSAPAIPLERIDSFLEDLEPGDIILFDWAPTSELSDRMIEHLRNPQRTLPYDICGVLFVVSELIRILINSALFGIGIKEGPVDGMPGKFDHCALFVGKCSDGLKIARAHGAVVAEGGLQEILETEGDVPVLIEAIGGIGSGLGWGVRVFSIDEYFKWCYRSGAEITVVRVKGVDERDIEQAIGFALSKCGLQYDSIPLIHGTGGWTDAVVEESAYYCSELVWAAYYYASDGRIDLNTFAFSNPIGCNPILRANPVLPDEIYFSSQVDIVSLQRFI